MAGFDFTSALQKLATGLEPLAAQGLQRSQDKMMGNVFALNPDFGSALYGAKNQQAQTALEQRRLALAAQVAQQEQQRLDALRGLATDFGGGKISMDDLITKAAIETGDIGPLATLAASREKAAQEARRSEALRGAIFGASPSQIPVGTSSGGGSNPLNVRNNNAGNIRDPRTGAFKKFASPEEGLAAMANDLTAKVTGNSNAMKARYGANYTPTLANVISTWAPPSENDTGGYISFVSKKTGINPNKTLTPADIQKIMPAMIEMEGGADALSYFAGQNPVATPVSNAVQNPALSSLAHLAAFDPETYGAEYLKAQIEAAKPADPSTDIGKMQRDEELGLVPKGSTDELIKQKNRQTRKEETELKATEAAAKEAEKQEKVTREVANTKMKEAFGLLQKGGMNVGGLAATASLYLPGKSTDADKLSSIYSTIKSVISLDKLMEMKKASPTGASGFGALSAPELQLLVDSVSSLDPELPIETQKENLNTISRILGYGGGALTPDKQKRLEELRAKRDAGTLK